MLPAPTVAPKVARRGKHVVNKLELCRGPPAAPQDWRFFVRSQEGGALLADGKTREGCKDELVRVYPKTENNGMLACDVPTSDGTGTYKAYLRVDDARAAVASLHASCVQLAAYEALESECRAYADFEWLDTALPREETLAECIRLYIRALAAAGVETTGFSVNESCGITSHPKYAKDGEKAMKASFHVVFRTSHAFRRAPDLKKLLEMHLTPLLTDAVKWTSARGQLESCVDLGVYGSFQCFRLQGQAKLGTDRKARPFVFAVDGILGDGECGLIGLYGDEVAPATYWEPPPPEVRVRKERAPRAPESAEAAAAAEAADDEDELQKFPPSLLSDLVALLPGDVLGEETRFRLYNAIWNASTPEARLRGEARALCLSLLAKRGKEGSAKDVAKVNAVTNVNNACDGKYRYNFGTLLREVRLHAPEQCQVLLDAYAKTSRGAGAGAGAGGADAAAPPSTLESFFAIPSAPAKSVCHDDWVTGDAISESLDACPTLLLKAALGLGKTTAIRTLCGMTTQGGAQQYPRALFVSARRSFTRDVHQSLRCMGFKSYLELEGSLRHVERLILQAESLHRIGPDCPPFDLVIVDESESVLQAMGSLTTHKHMHSANHEVLGAIVASAKRVIFADAFLGERTASFSKDLRGDARFVHYSRVPVERVAVRLADKVYRNAKRELKTAVNLEGFWASMERSILARKRIGVFWQSRTQGLRFEERLKQLGASYRYFHGKSSQATLDELLDVHGSWSSVQVVMYSPAITVGVSYDPADSAQQFDELFAFFTPQSCTPRDCAQAMQRIRHLKDGKLTYVISGDHAEDDVDCLTLEQCDAKVRAHEELAIATLGEFDACPPWARKLAVANAFDRHIGVTLFKSVLERLLEESGHTLVVEGERETTKLLDAPQVPHKWDDIPLITRSEAAVLASRKKHMRLEDAEFLALQKHNFIAGTHAEVSVDTLKERWDATVGSDVSTHAARYYALHHHATKTADDDRAYVVGATFAHEADLRRPAYDDICRVVGIANGWQPRDIPLEEFEALLPELQQRKDTWRNQLRMSSHAGPLATVRDAVSFLHDVFERWNGVPVVLPSKVVKREKKAVRVPGTHVKLGSEWWQRFYAEQHKTFFVVDEEAVLAAYLASASAPAAPAPAPVAAPAAAPAHEVAHEAAPAEAEPAVAPAPLLGRRGRGGKRQRRAPSPEF